MKLTKNLIKENLPKLKWDNLPTELVSANSYCPTLGQITIDLTNTGYKVFYDGYGYQNELGYKTFEKAIQSVQDLRLQKLYEIFNL